MNEFLAAERPASPSQWRRRLALIGAAALLYGIAGCSNTLPPLAGLAKGGMAKLKVAQDPQPAPSTAFTDLAGKAHTLSEFKGKVTIVNIWARWCGPCVLEIPSLAKLAAANAGKPVAVVAIDLDKGDDMPLGRAFIAKNAPLTYYSEPTYALPYALKPIVEEMPTTVIYDRTGVERARLAGGADWAGTDAQAVVDALLKAP